MSEQLVEVTEAYVCGLGRSLRVGYCGGVVGVLESGLEVLRDTV